MNYFAYDFQLVIAAVTSLTSLLVPVLFVPAVLLTCTRIWSTLLAPKAGHYYNIIDKNAKSDLAGVAQKPAASAKDKDDPLASWKSVVSYGEAPALSNVPCPLTFLPAPWEDKATLLRVIGEDDTTIDQSRGSSWIGLDDAEGYAIRVEMTAPRRCRFVRIGRVDEHQPSAARTPFVSEVADPFSEALPDAADVNADKRATTLDASTRRDETIRSGDIVLLVDDFSKKHLTVSGWWVLLSDEAVTANAYFVVCQLNDAGDVVYGAPIIAGSPFRLRSARYPKYEVGVQTQASIENRGNMLVMYEFSKTLARGSVRWKQGGQVNPLFLCTLPSTVRTSLHSAIASQRQHKWNIYGGIVSGLSYLRRHPIQRIQVVGHAEVLHRLLNKVFLIVVVVVSGSDEYGDKEWTCLRGVKEIDRILVAAETAQDAALHKRGNDASDGKSGNKAEGHRPLQHESLIAQDVRLMNYRFHSALKRDKEGARGAANAVFLNEFKHPSLWDAWAFTGSLKELGVSPPSDKTLGLPLFSCCIARFQWESYVREEFCLLYSTQLSCFAPFSSRPSWTLQLREIVGLADVYLEESPLPGTYGLRVETMGRIYYLSCRSFETRETLRDSIAHQIAVMPAPTTKASPFSSLLGGASPDSFTHVSGQWLPNTRLILNARKFPFDSQSRSSRSRWLKDETFWRLSEHLLLAASEMELLHYERGTRSGGGGTAPASPGNGSATPASTTSTGPAANSGTSASSNDDYERDLKTRLLAFIDETALLRLVDLRAMDLNSKEALCFFSNVYHTLLLHSRTVLRLPSKADWGLFFSSVSYSIGDDVFSLSELEQCVLRGRLSRPRVTSRHDPAVLPLSDSHFAYALEEADCRINFMLNSGSVSNPESIYLLTPRNLEQQLNLASQVTLTHSMSVDFGYHTVTLPKICEVYRTDMGGEDSLQVLQTCLDYLVGTNSHADLESIMSSGSGSGSRSRVPTIKYLLMTYESRARLVLSK